MTEFNIQGKLRSMVQTLRTTPTPLAHMIPLLQQAADTIDNLTHERDQWKRNAEHWKANHDKRVAAARVLIERPDLPAERTRWYQEYLEMQQELEHTVDSVIKCGDKMRQAVDALRGPPPPNCGWSTHDIVELCKEAREYLKGTPFEEKTKKAYDEFAALATHIDKTGDFPPGTT